MDRLSRLARHKQKRSAPFALGSTRIHAQGPQRGVGVIGNSQREAENRMQRVRAVESNCAIQQIDDEIGQGPQYADAFIENNVVVEIQRYPSNDNDKIVQLMHERPFAPFRSWWCCC